MEREGEVQRGGEFSERRGGNHGGFYGAERGAVANVGEWRRSCDANEDATHERRRRAADAKGGGSGITCPTGSWLRLALQHVNGAFFGADREEAVVG